MICVEPDFSGYMAHVIETNSLLLFFIGNSLCVSSSELFRLIASISYLNHGSVITSKDQLDQHLATSESGVLLAWHELLVSGH